MQVDKQTSSELRRKEDTEESIMGRQEQHRRLNQIYSMGNKEAAVCMHGGQPAIPVQSLSDHLISSNAMIMLMLLMYLSNLHLTHFEACRSFHYRN